MNTDCNPAEQNARQELLESWYVQDGREDPSHPLHASYTGLAEKYAEQPKSCEHDVCPCSLER